MDNHLESEQQWGEHRREEEDEWKKQVEDASRIDRTVMVVGLNIKADERDIFEFFTASTGKVRDVQIIRDARTGRSKGVCYVEFYSHEGMIKSLAVSGQTLKGQVIRVQPSQAEGGRMTHASQSVYMR